LGNALLIGDVAFNRDRTLLARLDLLRGGGDLLARSRE
jgi:hypothetical protein